MMWLGIAAIVMMFIGFSSAYVVAKGDATWVSITLPNAFYISSVFIVISSITYFVALRLAKQEKKQLSAIFVVVTLILGLLFAKFQIDGWGELTGKRMNFVDAENIEALIQKTDGEYGVDYKIIYKGKE